MIGSRDGEARDIPPRRPDRRVDFPVSLTAIVGDELRLRPSLTADWALDRGGQRVGWLKLYGPGEVASMACREGAWSLKQRGKYGWELVIASSDGRHVGWYSGHHWLPGGTIVLSNGQRVDLRRSLDRRWYLRVSATRERIVQLSQHGLTLSLAIRSLPPEIYSDAPMIMLTTCSVLMLMATAVPMPIGSGA